MSVIVQSSHVPTWTYLVPMLAVLATLIIGILTVVQRTRADGRSEWWRRAAWAMDNAMSNDTERAEAGLQILGVLTSDSYATPRITDAVTAAARARLGHLSFEINAEDVAFELSEYDEGGGDERHD